MITPLACSLVGKQERVTLIPGTRAAAIYAGQPPLEDFRCSFGVDRAYHAALTGAGLTLSGFGDDGELRVIELPRHPFFVATLYLPQLRSSPERPHPLFVTFARAAR